MTLFTALIFCASCGGKGDKYPDIDDDNLTDEDDMSGDTDPSEDADTDEEEHDGDTDPDDDSKDDTDSGHEAIDNDSNDDDSDTDPHADTEPDESDTDTKDDSDTEGPDEQPNIDEKDDPAVLCTGQTQCFNNTEQITCPASQNANFYGQDGQYATNGYCLNKSFSTTTDLVTDNITKLVWQRVLPSIYDGCSGNSGGLCLYSEALAYCENLTYAGYSDWRLPTPEEIATIVDYGKTSPAIDSAKFITPETQNKNFWIKTSNSTLWYIDFTSGEIQQENEDAKYVRCVRGDQLEKPDFTILNEGDEEEIVEDSVHNLYWTKKESETSYNWPAALKYCQDLEYGGHSGWRLPSINELASFLDYSLKKPASAFPGLASTSFWSSTSVQIYAPNAWKISSSNGIVDNAAKSKTFKVLCVK